MDKSQWEISPGFITLLLGVFLLCLIAEMLLPAGNFTTKAKIVNTRSEEAKITSALKERTMKNDAPTNIDVDFIYHALFGTNSYSSHRTNTQGEILDLWQMPYQIEIVARTNFVVRSAGPDNKFGDADDIIFNSVSNDFVKP
jgi:hypothetical protein